MLSCDSFRDRLYDEDVRRALAGQGHVPVDVQRHREACTECRHEWDEAALDLATLPRLMQEAAPAAVVRHVRVGATARLRPTPAFDWTEGVVWAAVSVALSVPAAHYLPPWLPGVGPMTLAFVAAALAFAAAVSRDIWGEALH
jgi:hypothetical protein